MNRLETKNSLKSELAGYNMARPNLFIGSSSKGLPVADAISIHLEKVANIEIWNEGVFGLSHGTLEDLVAALDRFEFVEQATTSL